MNALDFDKLSKVEKRKLGEYCNKTLNKRLKKIGNEINKFESEVKKDDYTGQVRPGSDR